MVQPKNEQRVAVIQNPFVNWLFVTCLIDTLKDRDWMSGSFARGLLKAQRRAVKQFQSTSDTLKELCATPLRLLVVRPRHSADFSHCRKAILHFGQIALRLPGVAPAPVNA